MENNNTMKILMLISSDGQQFVVPEAVAMESELICNTIKENSIITNILLTDVNAMILAKVLEYCHKHAEQEKTADISVPQTAEAEGSSSALASAKVSNKELREWDCEFMKVDLNMLYDLLVASNYLNVKGLVHLTAQSIANMLKGKSVEEMREILNIKSDFTPEEEEEIRMEHPWAFE